MRRVIANLTNSDWRMRESAVEILLHVNQFPADVVEILKKLLKTEAHENVRRQVVSALVVARPVDLAEMLLGVLEDSDYIVRSRAFSGLTQCMPDWRDNPSIKAYMASEVHPLGIWHIKDATK